MPYLLALGGALLAFGTELVDQVPEDLRERGTEIIDTVKANPGLLTALIIVGVITTGIFIWGLVKNVFKAALFGGLASAGVWYWYFNIR